MFKKHDDAAASQEETTKEVIGSAATYNFK